MTRMSRGCVGTVSWRPVVWRGKRNKHNKRLEGIYESVVNFYRRLDGIRDVLIGFFSERMENSFKTSHLGKYRTEKVRSGAKLKIRPWCSNYAVTLFRALRTVLELRTVN